MGVRSWGSPLIRIVEVLYPEKKRDRLLFEFLTKNNEAFRSVLHGSQDFHAWSMRRGSYFKIHSDLCYLLTRTVRKGMYVPGGFAWTPFPDTRWLLYKVLSIPLEEAISTFLFDNNLLYREITLARINGAFEGELLSVPGSRRASSEIKGPPGIWGIEKSYRLLKEIQEALMKEA